jgi:dihydrofolate synthase/folylpolyglutamate synthase
MTYAETIEYLFTRLPLFSRIGAAAYKKDLTNTLALCEYLGNPHKRFKTIHVGGTNGKGSVSHMLAATLQTAGYKTGLYTSPHLYDFRERIKINGEPVPEAEVIAFTTGIKPLIEELSPSFFEITVAMAFHYFAKEAVDIAIIEVGLGGRLDSTNIIVPELSIITNIGWDHMNLLGDSLEAIAREKAGIIKPNTPVVIGERSAETSPLFESTAAAIGAPIGFAEDSYRIKQYTFGAQTLSIEMEDKATLSSEKFELDLPGIYQLKNSCTVRKAVDILRGQGWKIAQETVAVALANVKRLTGLRGRWEVISQSPTVVLEVAHNKDGVTQLLNHLEKLTYKDLHLVFGMVKDKEAADILSSLPRSACYYFTQAHIPRALPAAVLRKEAATFGLNGDAYPDVNEALAAAKKTAVADDLIIVCGSIFLVAEVDRAGV